jgi:hypothetical protein
MIVGNFRNKSDQEKKMKGYNDALDLQIELSRAQEVKSKQAQRDLDLGIAPGLPPIRSVEEEMQDITFQKNTALKHLQTVLPRDALAALAVLGDDLDELVRFNRHWSTFKPKIQSQKLISIDHFRAIWGRYKELLTKTGETGIEIPLTREDVSPPVPPKLSHSEAARKLTQVIDELKLYKAEDRWNRVPAKLKALVKEVVGTFEKNTKIKTVLAEAQKELEHITRRTGKDDPEVTPDEAKAFLKQLLTYLRAEPDDATFGDLTEEVQAGVEYLLHDFSDRTPIQEVIAEVEEELEHVKANFTAQPTTGRGLKKRRGVVIRGRGLGQPQPQERYNRFGKYVIHTPSLQKGVFNIKYPSLANIAGLPSTHMSQAFRDFVLSVLQTGRLNMKAYRELTESERQLFNKAARRAGLEDILGIDDDAFQHEEARRQLLQRFEVLRGEVMAGNDAPAIKKELKKLVTAMITEGLITQTQGLGLLVELL